MKTLNFGVSGGLKAGWILASIMPSNMNSHRPPITSKKHHLSPMATRGYSQASFDECDDRNGRRLVTDRFGFSASFRVLDHSTGSLSDGEVVECGPNGDTITTKQGLSNLDHYLTPLDFSALDVEAGSDLLNVFTKETLQIMASNFNYKIVTKEELEGRRSSGVLGS